jgi:hypothetical protein
MLSLEEAEYLGTVARDAAQITRDNTLDWWGEEDVTDEFLNNLVSELNSASLQHLISTDEFSKRGPTAESAVGADFLFVVVYATEAAITQWGFVSQAKYYDNAKDQSDAADRLANQCATMRGHTPASFANIFYDDTYRFFPASQIAADRLVSTDLALSQMSTQFSNRATQKFFKEVFYGLWGDHWVAENADRILRADSEAEVPNRGLATDGGEDAYHKRGVVTILKEDGVEYSVTERLKYENTGLFTDTDI